MGFCEGGKGQKFEEFGEKMRVLVCLGGVGWEDGVVGQERGGG